MGARVAILGRGTALRACDAQLIEAIAAHWPDTDTPEFCAVSNESLREKLSQVIKAHQAFLVLGDDIKAMEQFHEVWDALQQASVAILWLKDEVSESAESSGLIECPHHEKAEHISIRLHTLLARQQTVAHLAREVRMLQKIEGNLHVEFGRLQEELQLAAAVQREMLPKALPEIASLRIGTLFRPVGYVSGDIYTVERLSERSVGIFLADAVGHGVPAALMTMVISRSLRFREAMSEKGRMLSPGEILTRLNEEMLLHQECFGGNGRFATAICCIIDVPARRIVMASAGHPQPLRINATGQCCKVPVEGAMLGIFPNEQYAEVVVELAEAERLLMFTDGFETAYPNAAADLFGRRLPNERYIEQMSGATTGTGHPADVLETLRLTLNEQLGSLHQVDDITAVCFDFAASEVKGESVRAA